MEVAPPPQDPETVVSPWAGGSVPSFGLSLTRSSAVLRATSTGGGDIGGRQAWARALWTHCHLTLGESLKFSAASKCVKWGDKCRPAEPLQLHWCPPPCVLLAAAQAGAEAPLRLLLLGCWDAEIHFYY